MKCPKCKGMTIVKDSRPYRKDLQIRRRRQCTECNYKFFTVETVKRITKQGE